MIWTNKKRHRTVEIADPDLGRAGIEIEGAFFVDLGSCIRWGEDFDANFWGAGKNKGLFGNLGSVRREPSDVDGFDAAGRGDGTLRRDEALWERVGQKRADKKLTAGVRKSGRGRHEDMSVLIGLDPVRELGEVRVGNDLGPTSQVELGLRSEIGQRDGDRHDVKQSMKEASKQRVKSLRALAIGCLAGLALLWALCQAGLRINGTDSEPVGIYWAVSKVPAKGDLVFALPPAMPIFRLAKERGYLVAGPSPAGTCGLIKQIVAASGDRVTIDREGVRVNGLVLKNSAPRLADQAGQLMPACYLSNYTLGDDEMLLMSDYNPASFDGRYFGPLPKTTIQSVIVPVITWK